MAKTKLTFTVEDRELLKSLDQQNKTLLRQIEIQQKQLSQAKETAKEEKRIAAEKAKADAEASKRVETMTLQQLRGYKRRTEAAAIHQKFVESSIKSYSEYEKKSIADAEKADANSKRKRLRLAKEVARVEKQAWKELEREKTDAAIKAAQAASKSTASMQGGVSGVASAWVGVGAAMAAVAGAYAGHEQRLASLAEKARSVEQAFIDALFASGDASRGPEVIAKLRSAAPGMDDEQRAQVFKAVAASTSDKSLDEKVGIVGALSPLVKGGLSAESAAQVGSLAGEFVGPNKSAGDAVDMAVALRDMVGQDDFEGLKQAGFLRAAAMAQGQGMSLEQGVGFGAAAMLADVDPRAVEKALAATGDTTLTKRKGRTAGDKAYNRFVAADAAGRRDMLLNDAAVRTELLGGVGAGKMGLIDRASIDANAARLTAAQTGDLAAQRGGELARISPGAALEQASRSEMDRATQADQVRAQMRADRNAFVSELEEKANVPYLMRPVGRAGMWLNQFMEDTFTSAQGNDEVNIVRDTFGDKAAGALARRQAGLLQKLVEIQQNSRPAVVENPDKGR